jgi:hypothetical protein
MLALKKKREAEAKVAAEEKAEADKMEVETPASTAAASGPAKVSLLGIGGKKKTGKNGDSKTAGKKRSPGEIRIQKGTFSYSNSQITGLPRKNYTFPLLGTSPRIASYLTTLFSL